MWTDSGLVFTGLTGKPVDPRADHRDWQQLLRRAGVPAARLHDARHTAATLLLAQGVPARVVMALLGHSQITLTLGTYTHVVPELARDAAARMGDALWGARSDSDAPHLLQGLSPAHTDVQATRTCTCETGEGMRHTDMKSPFENWSRFDQG